MTTFEMEVLEHKNPRFWKDEEKGEIGKNV
jgi:hypothetical protein